MTAPLLGAPRHTVLTLLAVATLPVMGGAAIAPALPAIAQHHAGLPNAELLTQLVLTLPALAAAVTSPVLGRVIDRVGAQPVMLASLLVFVLAGLSGAWLESLHAILVGRAVLGAAIGGLMASLFVAVAQVFNGPSRGSFMGWQGTAMSAGGLGFIAGGGLLADVSWHAAFGVYLLALPIGWAVWRLALPGAAQEAMPVAAPGATSGARSGAVRAQPGGESIEPASRARAFLQSPWVVPVAAFAAIALFYLIPVQSPFLLASLGAGSASQMGLGVMASTLTGAISASTFGRLAARLGAMRVIALATAVMAAGYAGVALASSVVGAVAALAVAGVGTGWLMPGLNAWMVQRAPVAQRGRFSGWLATAIALGQFGSPLLAHVFIAHPLPGLSGVGSAFAAATVGLLLLGLAMSCRLPLPRPVHAIGGVAHGVARP
jgi:MFS family permease